MNYFWLSCAALMIGAAITDLARGHWDKAAIATCYAIANIFLSLPPRG